VYVALPATMFSDASVDVMGPAPASFDWTRALSRGWGWNMLLSDDVRERGGLAGGVLPMCASTFMLCAQP
jgi:hypothetical protein